MRRGRCGITIMGEGGGRGNNKKLYLKVVRSILEHATQGKIRITMKKISPKSQIVIYKTDTGETKIDVRFDGETVWLTLEQMANLFDKAKSTINEHILNIYNIYKEGELKESETIQKIGNSDFLVKPTHYYNLDVIFRA